MALLEVQDIQVYYGMIQALKGVSFSVNEGEVIALIGANGAGKTTTLHTVTGLLRAKSGHIIYDGQDITKVPPHKIVTMGMAHVPEGRRVFANMTVLQNLKMGAYTRSDKNEIDATIEKVYKRFPRLKERQNQTAGTLSGGEQQMLAMGRALMSQPKMHERIGKLSGGVAVIHVGAATEVEMKEKKLRIEDALSATKAAVEEGIVAGGGTALINAIPAIEKLVPTLKGDEKTGAEIILRALEAPLRQIAANAGLEGSVIIDKIRRSRKVGYGFDAYTETYCDMLSSGIVDPTKVTRSALQNAASIASMVLTTESAVANIKKDEPAAPAMPAGGMGGMY